MRHYLLLMLCMATAMQAQEEEVTMKEVVVSGARTVQLADRQVFYLTDQQRQAATSGYALLQQLALPHLRIDAAAHTIAALGATGSVEVRLNDVPASTEDLLSLDIEGVEAVEFIDHPGVRYGEGVAYVVNIRVKRPVSGYSLGADLSQALTLAHTKGTLFAKVNVGRSELGISYSADRSHYTGERASEQTRYELADGSHYDVERRLNAKDVRESHHALQLTYSLSDSDYVFQARLNHRQPIGPERTTAQRSFTENGTAAAYEDCSTDRSKSPSLDLYFHRDLPHGRQFSANVVGTLIDTRSHTEHNEQAPYQYDTRGKTSTLWAEAVYEQCLLPFTLTAGMQYLQRYSDNVYEGDAEAHNRMRTSGQNVFAQLSGKLWQKLSYVAGGGISRRYFSQAGRHQDFVLFRPKLSVAYPPARHWRVKYDFEISQHTSQIALVSDVQIRQNAMETLVGNPDLRPNRVTAHDLRLTFTLPRLMAELQAYYRLNAHCNMEKVVRQGSSFINTQTNQRGCNFFFVQPFVRCDVVPRHLTATAYAGFYRFFNYGDDYTHTYNAVNGAAWLQAYLGSWSLMAYADNGYRWMEGEKRGHQGAFWQLGATYALSPQWSVSLWCTRPFAAHPAGTSSEQLNRYIHRHFDSTDADQGNHVLLTLTWNYSHGRQYRDINRTLNHQDTETGIVK